MVIVFSQQTGGRCEFISEEYNQGSYDTRTALEPRTVYLIRGSVERDRSITQQ